MLSIKWNPQDISETWEYGELVMSCNGDRIGDQNSSNLLTIIGFMETLLEAPEAYDSEEYRHASAEYIFARLYDPFMVHKVYDKLAVSNTLCSLPENIISYVGDASMYDWAVILLNFSDSQRLLWANLSDDVIHECTLPPQSIQKAFEDFIVNHRR